MSSPLSASRLADLPVPPAGKSGWPWTEATSSLPLIMPDGKPWPRISIVTPSYNQAQFIEQTIRSVLMQGYPNLEFIIMDGGSSDGSVEIIEKYARWLTHWESGKDRGQSHAINKGFERATGEIIAWLNSDDFYTSGALGIVARNLAQGTGSFALAGHCTMVSADGRALGEPYGAYVSRTRFLQFWEGYQMHQPSIFWRREVMERIGLLDEEQHLIMDFDYWARVAEHFDFKDIETVLSCATMHEDAKTAAGNGTVYRRALETQAPRYWGSPLRLRYWQLKSSMLYCTKIRPPLSRLKNALLRAKERPTIAHATELNRRCEPRE